MGGFGSATLSFGFMKQSNQLLQGLLATAGREEVPSDH